jgi:hypothetical protein
MLRREKSAQMQCGGHGIKPIKGLLKKSIFALNFCQACSAAAAAVGRPIALIHRRIVAF